MKNETLADVKYNPIAISKGHLSGAKWLLPCFNYKILCNFKT